MRGGSYLRLVFNCLFFLQDITIMRQGIKLVRALGGALGGAWNGAFGAELNPGPGVQTDEDIETWLRNEGANSQFHPSSSCGMLPRAHGGVVDSKLRVYGAGAYLFMPLW